MLLFYTVLTNSHLRRTHS